MTAPPSPTLVAQSVLIDDDVVRILDRRFFPFSIEWVTCRTVEEVARAIEEMVTQSSGPYFAAAGGMVLAARGTAGRPRRQQLEALEQAAKRLVATRPTNNHIALVVSKLYAAAQDAAGDVRAAVEESAHLAFEDYLDRSRRVGLRMAERLRDGDTILTHCWADALLTETVRAALSQGKALRAFCTETRPYLQGSRLTAESLAELGVETTVITDGMAAAVMSRGVVTTYITAADRVTMDGHVINKVGTLQIALAAREFRVPYYVLVHSPDRQSISAADVPIEERDGKDVLWCYGVRSASFRAAGYYPAFDITPPRLVHGLVTDRGIFMPADAGAYYNNTSRASPTR